MEVVVPSLAEKFDTTSGGGELLLRVVAALAQMERGWSSSAPSPASLAWECDAAIRCVGVPTG